MPSSGTRLSYRQGGPAGYGLRRVLIDEQGNSKGELSRGEQKSLQTDRVILLPGPEEEQRVVQRMYKMFVNEGRPEREIAEVLNAEGHRTDLNRPWTRATFAEQNGLALDAYRFDTLDFFYALASRAQIAEVAWCPTTWSRPARSR